MKYEMHDLNRRKLPFIFHSDVMDKNTRDYTHWHENLEILCFYEGMGKVLCDSSVTDVKAGDIYVINSERLHMVQSDTEVKYYCLIVDAEFCRQNGIPVGEVCYREKIEDRAMATVFQRVVSAFEGNDAYKEAKVKHETLGLLLTLAEHYTVEIEQDEDDVAHLDNVKEAIRYIKENFQKNIGVNDICQAAGLSRAYFSRIFKQVTGFTVVNYVNMVRCQSAAKMLRTGKYRVKTVAEQCGFTNLSYFSLTYKKIMGRLPIEEK
ncbi:MAG: helix-turn-helix domain-containing protein [Ruminococcaceae bacterium]|nr:helix-turn-helix domain-containing protein [Oscillospiraceae bacterium]